MCCAAATLNKYVFNSHLTSSSSLSIWHKEGGKLSQSHRPAAVKL